MQICPAYVYNFHAVGCNQQRSLATSSNKWFLLMTDLPQKSLCCELSHVLICKLCGFNLQYLCFPFSNCYLALLLVAVSGLGLCWLVSVMTELILWLQRNFSPDSFGFTYLKFFSHYIVCIRCLCVQVWVHRCHGKHVHVRGPLSGVNSFFTLWD